MSINPLSNQNCTTQPTFINRRSNEYTQRLHYYPYAVYLDKSKRFLHI